MTDLGQELGAKSPKLVPWFAENQGRIRILTRMLAVLVGKMPAGLPRDQVAERAMTEAQQLVTAKLPAQQAWFETNKPLLRLISLRIRQALEPAREEPPVPTEALNAATNAALRRPDIAERIHDFGSEPMARSRNPRVVFQSSSHTAGTSTRTSSTPR